MNEMKDVTLLIFNTFIKIVSLKITKKLCFLTDDFNDIKKAKIIIPIKQFFYYIILYYLNKIKKCFNKVFQCNDKISQRKLLNLINVLTKAKDKISQFVGSEVNFARYIHINLHKISNIKVYRTLVIKDITNNNY